MNVKKNSLKKRIISILSTILLFGVLVVLVIYIFTPIPIKPEKITAIDYNATLESREIRHLDQRAYQLPSLVLYTVESKDSERMLIDDMADFGFLFPIIEKEDKVKMEYPLPIGYSENTSVSFPGSPVATINCAACHTGSIRVDGQQYFIDGAANLVNMSEWALHVDRSLTATIKNPFKVIKTLSRWKKLQKSKKLPPKLDPKVTNEELEEISENMEDIFDDEREIEMLKNGNEDLSDFEKLMIVEDSHEYVLAQTVLDGLKLNETDPSLETIVELYKKNLLLEAADIEKRTNGRFDNAFSDKYKPSREKFSGFKGYEDALSDIITKAKRFTKLLSKLKSLKERSIAVAKETGNSGPGRDDAWYTLTRLVGEVPADQMRPGAPVKVPNLFSYAYYYKTLYATGGRSNSYKFHCDGNTNSILERNIMQGLALGTNTPEHGTTDLNGVRDMYLDVSALTWADDSYKKIKIPNFKDRLGKYFDKDKAKSGKEIFHNKKFTSGGISYTCSSCHSNAEGVLIPINIVATDDSRLNVFKTPAQQRNFKALEEKLNFKINNYYIGIGERRPSNSEGENSWKGYTGGYMARPLNGVWSSPPYLHNGSVRTLWELLKAPEDREDFFYTGTRNYDPQNVGYKSEEFYSPLGEEDHEGMTVRKIGAFRQENLVTVGGEIIRLNRGHGFGSKFEDEEKRALIEYLKSLGEPTVENISNE